MEQDAWSVHVKGFMAQRTASSYRVRESRVSKSRPMDDRERSPPRDKS